MTKWTEYDELAQISDLLKEKLAEVERLSRELDLRDQKEHLQERIIAKQTELIKAMKKLLSIFLGSSFVDSI